LIDVQRNKRAPNCLTFYLNHDVIQEAVCLGIRINPRPEPAMKAKPKDDHFVHYVSGSFGTDAKTLAALLKPNATLLLDIEMIRFVRSGVFRLTTETNAKDFTSDGPEGMIE